MLLSPYDCVNRTKGKYDYWWKQGQVAAGLSTDWFGLDIYIILNLLENCSTFRLVFIASTQFVRKKGRYRLKHRCHTLCWHLPKRSSTVSYRNLCKLFWWVTHTPDCIIRIKYQGISAVSRYDKKGERYGLVVKMLCFLTFRISIAWLSLPKLDYYNYVLIICPK